jgi:uncharacterized membrane protein YdfJ with MMPL/SSD domain
VSRTERLARVCGGHPWRTILAWVGALVLALAAAALFLPGNLTSTGHVTGNPESKQADALSYGVGSTARIITGAALIIVAVFLGFAMGDLVMFQQMGFGIAVALLIDATIIRSVLLPAAMTLLGRWNWYLPRWLAWLPRLEVEPAA